MVYLFETFAYDCIQQVSSDDDFDVKIDDDEDEDMVVKKTKTMKKKGKKIQKLLESGTYHDVSLSLVQFI